MIPTTEWVDDLNSNARNWVFKIKMKRGVKHPKAIWGQEFFEARLKLVILVAVLGFGIAGVLYWLPLNFIGLAIGLALYLPPVKRWMELVGHEIEVQAAVRIYGVSEVNYRRKEANSLKSYPQFKGRGYLIEKDMRKQSSFARKFVEKHLATIHTYGSE